MRSRLADSILLYASLPSCLSTIVMTLSTVYPASRIRNAACILLLPLVTTSSNITILESFGGKLPSNHAFVPYPFGFFLTMIPSRSGDVAF